MDAAVIAAMIALPLSALLATIEIARASGAGRSAMFRFPMLAYMLILALGNVFTTFLAASTLHDNSPSTAPPWFWYVFIGVFGFEAILKRVNLTFSGIGVLSINDWITKARDSAVADAIEAGVQRDETDALRLAERLPADLAHTLLSKGVVQKLVLMGAVSGWVATSRPGRTGPATGRSCCRR